MSAPAALGPWVLGLDMALNCTGIAYVDGTVGVFKPAKALRGMARLDAVLGAVTAACELGGGRPDLVVIEGYSMGSKGRAVIDLAELGGIIRHHLFCARQHYIEVPPPSLKIYATGSGHADKIAMVVAARERLAYAGKQPDEADALWLRAFGHDLLGAPLVVVPKTHRRALDAVALGDPPLPPEDRRWPLDWTAAASGRTSTAGNGT